MAEITRLDPLGRLLIPARIRGELGLLPESEVLIRVENEGLRLETRATAVRRVQKYMKQFKKPGESVVDEFVAERREEARCEVAPSTTLADFEHSSRSHMWLPQPIGS